MSFLSKLARINKHGIMKIIHTSDWHLGQTFFGYDRAKEHHCFLEWLKGVIKENGTDLLLIAGDVFDTPNPSAESQKIYYRFIKQITTENPGLQIIITSGNHDSAARLEAPNPLLEELNIAVRGVVHRTADGEIDYERHIIPIKMGCCLAVPYLRQGDYPAADTHGEGVKNFYSKLYSIASEKYKKIIAMGHLQATGSEISNDDRSERTTIGGLDAVNPDFSDRGIIYTALGHLHKAQRVSGRENMRYSGSPLPMSFAERRNKQSVTLITTDGENTKIEKINFEPPVKLLTIPASGAKLIEDVVEELKELKKSEEGDNINNAPYLEVQVLVDGPDPTRRTLVEKAIEGKYVRLARIVAVSPQSESNENTLLSYDDLKKIEPIELAKIVYKQRYDNAEMTENLVKKLNEIIKEVENENISNKG